MHTRVYMCVHVCVCVYGGVGVSGFALSDPCGTKTHHMGHSLAVRSEYLPVCLRFSSHIVTLFKATQGSVMPVCVALYLHITFCWKTQASQKKKKILQSYHKCGRQVLFLSSSRGGKCRSREELRDSCRFTKVL